MVIYDYCAKKQQLGFTQYVNDGSRFKLCFVFVEVLMAELAFDGCNNSSSRWFLFNHLSDSTMRI